MRNRRRAIKYDPKQNKLHFKAKVHKAVVAKKVAPPKKEAAVKKDVKKEVKKEVVKKEAKKKDVGKEAKAEVKKE